METSLKIKFHTLKLINGIKYLSSRQVEDLQYIVCADLEIERSEENFTTVKQAISIYFNTQNSLPIS